MPDFFNIFLKRRSERAVARRPGRKRGGAHMSIQSIFAKKNDDRQVPEIEVKGDEVTLVGKDNDAEDRTVKMSKTKFA